MTRSSRHPDLELLRRAMALHQAGHLDGAAEAYERALKRTPTDFHTLRLFGICRLQQGNFDQAELLLSKALKRTANSADTHYYLGRALWEQKRKERAIFCFNKCISLDARHEAALVMLGCAKIEAGDREQALECFQRALAANPASVDALFNAGKALQALQRYVESLDCYDRAIRIRPDFTDVYIQRGQVLRSLERHCEALASYDKALAIRPDNIEALTNRASVLLELKQYESALAAYDKALAIRPDRHEVFNWRGNVLFALKDYEQALASYRKAVSIHPTYIEALTNCASALSELKRYEEALAACDQALAIDPDFAPALNSRGIALSELGRAQEALASYDRAVALKPDFPEAFFNRGMVMRDGLNRRKEAIASYEKALAIRHYPEARFAACVSELPILYADEDEIAVQRATYAERLAKLCEDVERSCPAADWSAGVGARHPFFLAYQGMNNRDLARRYGSLVCRIMAQRYPAVAMARDIALDEPIRLGIVSGQFCWHSVWKAPTKGWLSQLDRRRFRVFGYHTGIQLDSATTHAASMCDRFVQGPLSLDRWRQTILGDAPHVLLYPEIGMDPATAALGALRLAPVQCTSWGHPDTTGYPTIDYYLSSELMEPPDGDEHYSERLIRLPNLSIYYEYPENISPATVSRTELGLTESDVVYWCGQSLYKYLPQFDHVFARIAREVANCRFVFIETSYGAGVTEVFRQRLRSAFASFELNADAHCVFLPRLDTSRYVAAIGECDIILDSMCWSGFNSTMESLVYDLPIVTMTGPLMRSRHTAAIFEMMGVSDTVTDSLDDYVGSAVRLGRDVQWRMSVKASIRSHKNRVYRDRRCVSALEQFLDGVARNHGLAQTAPSDWRRSRAQHGTRANMTPWEEAD